MRPDARFVSQGKDFWAHVRTISQAIGYTERKKRKSKQEGQIKIPAFPQIVAAFNELDLRHDHIVDKDSVPTAFGRLLHEYFAFRADRLNIYVEPRLMDAKKAKAIFEGLRKKLNPKCSLPMNKQKGAKKAHAYLTGIVNMLVEANCGEYACNYDPGELTTVTKDQKPLRTLARRVDGAFPATINPIAVWEIKEYYYTTTFGSRVADGVYESLLDGMELEEVREHERIDVRHYLMVDAYFTWWKCGKSYLCRIFDMLHMGYVDEVLFGSEVVDELPRIVAEWCAEAKKQGRK